MVQISFQCPFLQKRELLCCGTHVEYKKKLSFLSWGKVLFLKWHNTHDLWTKSSVHYTAWGILWLLRLLWMNVCCLPSITTCHRLGRNFLCQTREEVECFCEAWFEFWYLLISFFLCLCSTNQIVHLQHKQEPVREFRNYLQQIPMMISKCLRAAA